VSAEKALVKLGVPELALDLVRLLETEELGDGEGFDERALGCLPSSRLQCLRR